MDQLSSGDVGWPVMEMLRRQEFRCSCLFPEGWRDGQEAEVDTSRYLERLMTVE